MLQVFLDESGKNEPCCAVAGYWGGENQWKKLATSWDKVIKREGVSEFHAKKFWARRGEFEGWDDERAGRFVNDLLSVIERTKIYPVAGAIVFDGWASLSLTDRRILTGAAFRGGKFLTSGKPSQRLFLPAQHCICVPVVYCKPGIVMSYAFDIDKSNDGWKGELYSYIRDKVVTAEDQRKMARSIGFVESVDSPEVQAADLLAWEVRRYCAELMRNPHARGRPEYRRAVKNRRNDADLKLFDKPSIDSMFGFLRERFGA